MKKFILLIIDSDLKQPLYNFALFFFRVAVATELFVVHGFKKIGIGVPVAEILPNPLGLSTLLNSFLIIISIVCLPLFIILGFFTRIAAFFVFTVTSIGYFIVHGDDPAAVRENPFLFTMIMLLLILLGGGKYSVDNYFSTKLN